MKFQDLKYPEDTVILRYKKSDTEVNNIKLNERVFLQKNNMGKENEYILSLLDMDAKDLMSTEDNNSVILNVTASRVENEKLESFFGSFMENVFIVRAIDKSNKSDVGEIHLGRLGFNARDLDMKFVINQKTVKQEKKDSEVIRKDILNNYLIEDFNRKCALIGVKTGFDKAKGKDNKREPAIVIKGKKGYYIVKKQKLLGEKYNYICERKTENIIPEKYEFYLGLNVDVTDDTDEGKIRQQKAEMLEKDNSVYLNEWIKYGEKEEERTYEGFKQAGILNYKGRENLSGNLVKFIIDDDKEKSYYRVQEAIERFDEVASEFGDIDVLRTIEFEVGDKFDPVEYKKKRNKMNPVQFKYCEADPESNTIILERTDKSLQAFVPQQGKLLLNIIGDCTRYERRKKAIERLKEGKIGIPHLLLLIEGAELRGRVEPKKVAPLSAEIREKCFPYGPTQNQLEAIEMALSTPDVALIQGPPGAGKTTVIAAIQARLEEEFKDDPTNKVVVLVTSDQHEAVLNAIKKMETGGSPVQKVGGRYKDSDNNQNLEFDQWIDDLKKDICQKYPNLSENEEINEFEELYKQFIRGSNSIQTTLTILERAKNIFRKKQLINLEIECENVAREIKRISREKLIPNEIMRSIKNIPTTNEHFEDGGVKELMVLSFFLNMEEQAGLKKLSVTLKEMSEKESLEPKDMARLKVIKEKLILKYTPVNPLFIDRKKHSAVEDIFEKGLMEIQKMKMQSGDAEERVVLEFYNELNQNPMLVQDEFKKYQTSIGATCQQAASGSISNVKGENVAINNVIIDEAARANPLDIIIPASMAREKVIFVGDQNQLPHIVEQEILDRIQNSDETIESIEGRKELLGQSMFGRLYTALKKSEERDGVKRVITLDKQFRMHPLLGNFVSENFYEKKVGVTIKSPRKAEEFQHSIPGLENKACVWIDVPYNKGGEVKGTSKTRPVEADQIAKHLKSIIDSPETKDFTFGVITFYKKQVREIQKALAKYGISKDKDKLLVGTVDAFQGKEFDVVYLSVVRSNKSNKTNAKYGHLTVDNRLCVSMSRQKKLLIVVGDAQMFTTDIEGKPQALQNFYNMCKEKKEYGKILNYLE